MLELAGTGLGEAKLVLFPSKIANNIPKQDYALCRIKKHLRGKKDDDDDDAVNMEEDDALETIQGMLLEPDSTCCTTQEVTEETDQWESIINEVCDEKIDGVENTTALVHGEYDLRGCGEIRDVQEDGVDGMEAMASGKL
ncbi:hypothetical protein CQW23_30584 [Capsicum baccatum]|uniref:Uncharacterized protein n=1 Tax=Capsicum baccatum TaxID=33114 RepID=A0A2G2VA52_CAPBA|nr:hypothetical protein CQW23_30584 [Capsicum baccatum]